MTEKAKESGAKKGEKKSEKKEAKQASSERIAFPEACIVRIMKKNMDKEKMIKKEVKVAMNKWLEKLVTNVAKTMNNFPYVMMTKSEFIGSDVTPKLLLQSVRAQQQEAFKHFAISWMRKK